MDKTHFRVVRERDILKRGGVVHPSLSATAAMEATLRTISPRAFGRHSTVSPRGTTLGGSSFATPRAVANNTVYEPLTPITTTHTPRITPREGLAEAMPGMTPREGESEAAMLERLKFATPNLPQFRFPDLKKDHKRKDFFRHFNGLMIGQARADQQEIEATRRANVAGKLEGNYKTGKDGNGTYRTGKDGKGASLLEELLHNDLNLTEKSFFSGFGEIDEKQLQKEILNKTTKRGSGQVAETNTSNVLGETNTSNVLGGSPCVGGKPGPNGKVWVPKLSTPRAQGKLSAIDGSGTMSARSPLTKEQQYLRFDGQVLRFGLVLHDLSTEAYERRFFTLSYFLKDDSSEIWELKTETRPPCCFFRREKLEGFNVLDDLQSLNSYVTILAREFYVYKADPFTKKFFKDSLNRDLDICQETGQLLENQEAQLEVELKKLKPTRTTLGFSTTTPRSEMTNDPKKPGTKKTGFSLDDEDHIIGAREFLSFVVASDTNGVVKERLTPRQKIENAKVAERDAFYKNFSINREPRFHNSSPKNYTQVQKSGDFSVVGNKDSRRHVLLYDLRTKEIRITNEVTESGYHQFDKNLFLRRGLHLNAKTKQAFEPEDFNFASIFEGKDDHTSNNADRTSDNKVSLMNNMTFRVLYADAFTLEFLKAYTKEDSTTKESTTTDKEDSTTTAKEDSSKDTSATKEDSTTCAKDTTTCAKDTTTCAKDRGISLFTPRSELAAGDLAKLLFELISKLRAGFTSGRDCFRYFGRDGFICFEDFCLILKHYGYHLLQSEKQKMFNYFLKKSDSEEKLSFKAFILVVSEKDFPNNQNPKITTSL